MPDDLSTDLSTLTAEIVANYVSHNSVQPDKLGEIIHAVHTALSTAGSKTAAEPETAKPDKAAIRKSQHADHLVSFLDGKKYKSLKRHLTTHDMTPDDYRAKFGLAKDYPMVAPSYSAQRSALAKSLGLGRKAAEAPVPLAKNKGRAKPAPKGAIKPEEETFS